MKHSHIFPFLWMRGEPEEVLRKEMEKLDESGIQAVCLEARPHPDYAGKGWWHDVDIIIDEAKKRDMQIWILDDAHFPTGMANGSMERHKDKARRWLYTQFVDVTGPMPSAQVDVDLLMTEQFTWMDIGKPQTKPLIDETRLLSVTAVRISDEDLVEGEWIDLTNQVSDGYLTADFSSGTWRVYVTFVTTAIGPRPDYINYIEEDSVRVLIDEVYEKHYERYKDLFGTVIAGFFSDEPGFYNTETFDENCFLGLDMVLPWGTELEQVLEAKLGKDLYRKLPLLYANETSGAHRYIRTAYMDAVSMLYGKNFCQQLGNWCRAHGVQYIGHVVEDNCGYMRLGAGVGHYFRAMSGQDMAGIDNIGYQLMPGNETGARHTGFQNISPLFYHYQLGKLGGSEAAIDPLKKGRLMCENFGAYGWRLGVRDMKWLVDYLVGQGVNHFVPHAFSMAEYPDADCPPHFYARGNNPQFPWFCSLMKYTDRLCRLFSDGASISQVAVLFEAEADWAGKTMRGAEVAKELINHQLDFTFLPSDVFEDAAYFGCRTDDGKLVVNGRTMDALIVPEMDYLAPAAAAFIGENPDVPVLYVNTLPVGIAGQNEGEEALLDDALKNRVVVQLTQLSKKLFSMGIRDAAYPEQCDGNLHQYHYVKDGSNYWLFMNASLSEDVTVAMHLPEGRYASYDAMDDSFEQLALADGVFSLHLPPYGSTVICDTADMTLPERKAVPEAKETVTLTRFDVELREIGRTGSEFLSDLELVPISSLKRDFSGVMVYRTNFALDELPERAFLRVEHVYECMEVSVNGAALGTRITPPYAVDVTEGLVAGDNQLEVTVASTALRNANTKPGLFGKERTVIEPTGMFGNVRLELS